MYDITSFESFEGAKKWVRELTLYGQPNVEITLAANKADLDSFRVISTREGQAYASENAMEYFETSAKTATDVQAMFLDLVQRVPRKDPALSCSSASLAYPGKSEGACIC